MSVKCDLPLVNSCWRFPVTFSFICPEMCSRRNPSVIFPGTKVRTDPPVVPQVILLTFFEDGWYFLLPNHRRPPQTFKDDSILQRHQQLPQTHRCSPFKMPLSTEQHLCPPSQLSCCEWNHSRCVSLRNTTFAGLLQAPCRAKPKCVDWRWQEEDLCILTLLNNHCIAALSYSILFTIHLLNATDLPVGGILSSLLFFTNLLGLSLWLTGLYTQYQTDREKKEKAQH